MRPLFVGNVLIVEGGTERLLATKISGKKKLLHYKDGKKTQYCWPGRK